MPFSPVEMFNELIAKGYIVPSTVEPSGFTVPTAYISVPTIVVFSTPPKLEVVGSNQATKHAKLEARSQRNTKGNKRSKRLRRR